MTVRTSLSPRSSQNYLLCSAHGALSCLLHYPVGTPFWCPLCEKIWKWKQGRQALKVDTRGVV